jgi:hypothetical protein
VGLDPLEHENAVSDAAHESVEGDEEAFHAVGEEFPAQAARFAIVVAGCGFAGAHGCLLVVIDSATLGLENIFVKRIVQILPIY